MLYIVLIFKNNSHMGSAITQLRFLTMLALCYSANISHAQQVLKPNIRTKPVKLGGFVILPVEELQAMRDAEDAKQDAPLSHAELIEVKRLLEQSIDDYYRKPNVIQLSNYNVQYFCALNEQGQKLVWINGYCKEICSDERWKKHARLVMDGGNCVIRLKINLDTKRHYGLGVNGQG